MHTGATPTEQCDLVFGFYLNINHMIKLIPEALHNQSRGIHSAIDILLG